MSDKMADLEKVLANDEALAAAYQEALSGAKDAGAQSDAEAIALAAKAAGVELTAEEVEQAAAATQELSDSDLETVSGGDFWSGSDDEYGHEDSCVAAWHCHVVLRHTDSESKTVSCWSDYACAFSYGTDPNDSY